MTGAAAGGAREIATATDLESVPVRIVGFPRGTTMRIDIEGADRSAELAWTRQKAHARGLRGLVLSAGCPPIAEKGFDVVHRMVERAAEVVSNAAGDEVGPIEIAICAVSDPEAEARRIAAEHGSFELDSLGGAGVGFTPEPR
ncbi:hypothetical protein [Dietzia sp.]|uniref:hypothetical protein n=1 Tax=Dietzia sp. TaxID=1871616 RepID=UPI002FDAC1BD